MAAIENTPTVLLVGNYPPDRQESMQRFASLLERVLPRDEWRVEVLRPEPHFNRLQSAGGPGKYLGYFDKLLVFPWRLRRRVRQLGRCVVHICDHSNAFYVPQLRGTPHLVTCHDLLAIRSARGEFPENPTRWSGRKLQQFILAGLRSAQHVACVSEATRRDLWRLTGMSPERTEVIHNALNYEYAPLCRDAAASILKDCPVPSRFLLHVGSDHWYKNRRGLIEIYAELRRLRPNAPALVLAGAELSCEQRRMIRALGLESHVTVVRCPANEVLHALYATAELLVFPSLVEGFGWPIIEAQACGCVVVASSRPPMNEVGGAAAVYIDPTDVAGAARVVAEILEAPPAEQMRQRKESIRNATRFSPAVMAAAYAGAYRALANGKVISGVSSGNLPGSIAGKPPLQPHAVVG